MANTIGPDDMSLEAPGTNLLGIRRDKLRGGLVNLDWRCLCLRKTWVENVPSNQVDGLTSTCCNPKCGKTATFVVL